MDKQQIAGMNLRRLIQENYPSQEAFAVAYCAELRTINRYINSGINKIDVIQELAYHFDVDFMEFFKEPQ